VILHRHRRPHAEHIGELARRDQRIADLEAELSRSQRSAKDAHGEAREAIGARDHLAKLVRSYFAACIDCGKGPHDVDTCPCACHRGRARVRDLLMAETGPKRRGRVA